MIGILILANFVRLYMSPRGLSTESLLTCIVHHGDICHDESMSSGVCIEVTNLCTFRQCVRTLVKSER